MANKIWVEQVDSSRHALCEMCDLKAAGFRIIIEGKTAAGEAKYQDILLCEDCFAELIANCDELLE